LSLHNVPGHPSHSPTSAETAVPDFGCCGGRDHNPYGFTTWLAGGGIKGGKTIGATDEFGFCAVEDRVHVNDLHATILKLLGLDHRELTYLFQGREQRLTDVGGDHEFAVTLLG
jgi:Protein of unknown function (DUF1501)